MAFPVLLLRLLRQLKRHTVACVCADRGFEPVGSRPMLIKLDIITSLYRRKLRGETSQFMLCSCFILDPHPCAQFFVHMHNHSNFD